jgi:MFS family permease
VLDSVTFGVSAALLAVFVPRQARPAGAGAGAPAEPAPGVGYWRDLGDGIRFLARTPVIRNLVLMIVITNCFDAAGLSVIFPVFARTISPGGAALGIMVALFSFGALAGAALFGWAGQRLPRRRTLVVCFLLAGAPPYLAMAAGGPVWATFLVIGLAGLAAGSINPLLSTVLYERIPRSLRARVLGALTAGVSAGMPVGSFVGGLVLSQAGLVPTLLAVGVLYAVVTLAPLVGRSWRELDGGARVASA